MSYVWPCPATAYITSYYGNRVAPTPGASTFHAAIDIGCPDGTQIVSIDDGTVYAISSSSLRGNYVRILHPDGRVSHYQHLQGAVEGLQVGQTVLKSELIAYSGHSGIGTGPHLDFRIYVNVASVGSDTTSGTLNPLSVIKPSVGGKILPAGSGEGSQLNVLENNRWISGYYYNIDGELEKNPDYSYTNYYCLPSTSYRFSKTVKSGTIIEFNKGKFLSRMGITETSMTTGDQTSMLGISMLTSEIKGFAMYEYKQTIPGVGGEDDPITAEKYFETIKLYIQHNQIIGYSQYGRLNFKKMSGNVYSIYNKL